MYAGLYVVGALFVLVLVTLAKGVRLVPQGYKWVVQRLGKYHCTLGPGLNILIPFVGTVLERTEITGGGGVGRGWIWWWWCW